MSNCIKWHRHIQLHIFVALSGKMATLEKPMNEFKSLSRKVYKVMEDIGAGLETRRVLIEAKTVREILYTVSEIDQPCSHYIFGSSFEGTSTTGLQSDLDEMVVDEKLYVVADVTEAPKYQSCYLIIQDQMTPPGYAKLQLVSNGKCLYRSYSTLPDIAWNLYEIDSENRCVFTVLVPPEFVYATERHGPAFTTLSKKSAFTQDTVIGFRSKGWPKCASEWFTRKRQYAFPSSTMTEAFKKLGCFFVCVGHPYSSERHLQWRISFSLQERMLTTHFNSVQLKCYVLMKLIKNKVILPRLGRQSISSYHCKTCMFYLIECTPSQFWTEENLLNCVLACLKLISMWLNENVCPNYFIPSENMFDGRLSRQIKVQLCQVLEFLTCTDFRYLLSIESDDFAQRLIGTPSSARQLLNGEHMRSLMKFDEYFACATRVQSIRKSLIQAENKEDVMPCLDTCFRLKSKLQGIKTVNEHTEEETRNAIAFILPYITLDAMSNLITISVRQGKSKEDILAYLLSDEWHRISIESDMFSSRLKQATYLYMFGHHDMSLNILTDLEGKISDQIITICNSGGIELSFTEKFVCERNRTSFRDLIRNYSLPCSLFYQSESTLTPIALRYEMLRKTFHRFKDMDKYWSACAEVDGKILLYFLLYLNHSRLGMDSDAVGDTRQLMAILSKDPNLGHKSTALNLLGWMFNDQGSCDKAYLFFRKSLIIKPSKNAALWHILWLIRDRFRSISRI